MKIKTNKLFSSICSMLLSILYFIRGVEYQVTIGRIGYLVCSIGFFIGSLALLYEWGKKFKIRN